MRTNEIYLTSSTKKDQIYVKLWIPDIAPTVIVQIAHDMLEHINRYEEFAAFLCEQGIAVIGNDHLGHGKTAVTTSHYGYFSKRNGKDAVMKDLIRVSNYARNLYPHAKLYLLGNGMGSFFVRYYLTKCKKMPDGAILIGSGAYSYPIVWSGRLLAGILFVAKGAFYRSNCLHYIAIGKNEAYFKDEVCKSWLTNDEIEAKKYKEDSSCAFFFTAEAYYELFSLLCSLAKQKKRKNFSEWLPMYFLSGEDDPVGGFGKGVKALYKKYRNMKMRDVTVDIYPGLRHELLHEIEKNQIYEGILDWIKVHSMIEIKDSVREESLKKVKRKK